MSDFAAVSAFLTNAFDDQFPARKEFSLGRLVVYIRVNARATGCETIEKCIVLARADVPERARNSGVFRQFLADIDAWLIYRKAMQPELVMGVLCEGVLNKHLLSALLRRGYQPTVHSHPRAPDLYRVTPLGLSNET